MKKTKISNNITRSLHKVGFKIKKHSPEILAVVGVVGVGATVVTACVATTKLSDILDETTDTIEKINETVANPDFADKYSEEDATKDKVIVYTQTSVKIAKLYAPSVILGVASVGCFLTSHNILRKRNIALAAAYATVDKGFKEYRSRVVERFGEALDQELRFNVKAKEFEEVVINEKGEEEIVKKTVSVVDPNTYSDYARFFDEACPGWSKDPEYNLTFLKRQQNFANEKLQTNGFLFLNDVYEMIGIPKTKAGQIVGWIYDEKNPVGDNFVDFGIYDVNNEAKRDFVNGYERSILLDFNVDGNIWDKM
jgi:hypothetical protein|nr:MAG TPA: hypothetical protein [Caudoviricetes sp.]